jgi:hypothetical protein
VKEDNIFKKKMKKYFVGAFLESTSVKLNKTKFFIVKIAQHICTQISDKNQRQLPVKCVLRE